MKYLRLPFYLLMLLSVISFTGRRGGSEYNVTINTSDVMGTVSPNIMGFNMVYCNESDEPWQSGSGKVAGMMKDIGVKQFRYPGGTVVTKYHWEKPTGQGWSDIWDPKFDTTKNTPSSSYMDIDEYLELTKKLEIEPLIGINMGSGMKYNRVQEGVNEAIRLMKHCLSKGVKVKYYYLDNEPYQPDANYTYKPEEYANMINTYVPAMKKIDPDIKIIVNTQPRTDIYIKPLLERAGKNIDMVDVHMYWKYRNATFNNWIAEPMMTHQGKGTYAQQKQIWEKLFADAGYPDIKLVVLEWNIGPWGQNTPPTETQAALMISEQFTQYIQSGLFMSCFWPLSLPGKDAKNWRPLFHTEGGYKPNKAYSMFAMYTNVLGQKLVSNKVSGERLITLSVKSNNDKTIWVYIINKNQDSASSLVNIALPGLKINSVNVEGFDSDGKTINKQAVNINQADAMHFKLNAPINSLIKLTFKTA
jgi:alpha-N-arabinofuranosidase